MCFIGQDNKEQVITTETVIKQVRPISVVLIFRWKLGENAIVKLLQTTRLHAILLKTFFFNQRQDEEVFESSS